MKKVTLLCVALLVATSALAADPSKIIVKYDFRSGMGDAVITALKTKWPAATVSPFEGSTWAAFISALKTQGPWSIVIVEGWYYRSLSQSDYQALADWYNSKVGPLFFSDWGMIQPVEAPLKTAMGISAAVGLSMPPRPHYAWVTTHAICSGITDWTYNNPGIGTGAHALTWTTAVPVTGWTTTQTPGQGGICVAPDKRSIISGYFPSLNKTQVEKLWSNILSVMWPTVGVAPASLGKVKALYR